MIGAWMSSVAGAGEAVEDTDDGLDEIVIGSVLMMALAWLCTLFVLFVLLVATGPLLALIPIRDPALTFFGHCIGHGQLVV